MGTLRTGLRSLPGWTPAVRRVRAGARGLSDRRAGTRFAIGRSPADLAVVVHEHRSPIARAHASSGHAAGKAHNLLRAANALDGVLLAPGEVLSFWRLVGPPLRRRGFRAGPVLTAGELDTGSGGGICAAANLLRWLALHADLDVVECAEHTVDPFPDQGRTVPWGTGCTVSWPRKDLRVANRSASVYQWRLEVRDGHLLGRLLADRMPAAVYTVAEAEAEYLLIGDRPHRRNRLVRRRHDLDGTVRGEEELARTLAPTGYRPPALGAVETLAPEPLWVPRLSGGGRQG